MSSYLRFLVAILWPVLSLLPSWVCAQSALPADVIRFMERRDQCDHFRGEEPYDAERQKFLERRTRELCTGTDRKLKALKMKYQAKQQVLSKLNGYEPGIEGADK
jgi:hypothetical protein